MIRINCHMDFFESLATSHIQHEHLLETKQHLAMTYLCYVSRLYIDEHVCVYTFRCS